MIIDYIQEINLVYVESRIHNEDYYEEVKSLIKDTN